MNEKDRKNLLTIISYCEKLEEYISSVNYEFEFYNENDMLKDACNMMILQIGEIINRLSDDFKNEHDNIDWRAFIGMRNIQAHRYEHLIDDIVWDTINTDVIELKLYLEKIL